MDDGVDVRGELLAACVAAPDDDLPRAVWADAVGGERGELVAVQLRLARGEGTAAQVGALLRRERELLAAHGSAWAPAGVARATFRRGFVETVEADARAFAADAHAILDAAPLLGGIALTGLEPWAHDSVADQLERVFFEPRARALAGLYLGPFEYGTAASAHDAVRVLHDAGVLPNLRVLGLASGSALAALMRNRALPKLERFAIDAADADLPALLARMPQLRALEIGSPVALATLLPVLPATLRELAMRRPAEPTLDRDLRVLGAHAIAERLESLRLGAGSLAVGVTALGTLGRLAHLDLGLVDIEPPARADMLATALPSLRALRVRGAGNRAWSNTLARVFGAQLELLEVVEPAESVHDVAEMSASVAGEARVVPSAAPMRPFVLAASPRMPTWVDCSVTLPRSA